MPRLLPTPKLMTPADGVLHLPAGATICAVADAAREPAAWLAAALPMPCEVTSSPADAQIILDLAPDSALESPAFASALGREQGYVLDVSSERAVLSAHTVTGLRHAAATLLQLIGPDGSVPCGRIDDRPDFRYRVADWLVNVEANRWGYERGDGREALFTRMCRKLDMAARYKLNVIWFDGFGWDPDRRPGYAEFARDLSRRARALGIRLAHGGYGGGYGCAYQKSAIYDAPYMGHLFRNRRPWPDGDIYDCIGHPGYEASWSWGTCLSNDGLRDEKLAEIARFVRECEPGLLYVHDIDSGLWNEAAAAWDRRCDQCRLRWPNDDAAAPDGMAGAYAEWFRALLDTVNAVRSEDGVYDGARDCIVAAVGPVYTHADDSDANWDGALGYFETVSRQVGPAPNLQFGIREQFASDREPRPRVPQLSALLDSIGNGHGILVACFAGGDSYYSDQLVAPAPTLALNFVGADTAYIVHSGAVEPAQLLAAEYEWHADAPGAAPLATDRADGLRLWEASRDGSLRPPEVYSPDGLLTLACEHLYGPAAGPHMAEMFSLGAGEHGPVAVMWRTITTEIVKLREGVELPERDTFWYDRAEVTRQAIALVDAALQEEGLTPEVAGDLRWLQATLEIGERFAEGLGMTWELLAVSPEGLRERVREHWAALERRIREDFSTDTFDPLGGDMGSWLPALAALAEMPPACRGR